jgi:hypothetical protein
MTTRSAVLGAATYANAGTWLTLSTVPTGEVWIVKSAQLWNASGGATTIYLRCLDPSTGELAYLLSESVAALAVRQWEGWVVIPSGTNIQLFSSGAPVYIWVSGARLIVP